MNLPDRRAGEQDADKLLRDLFQQAGALQAQEGLDARILQRIAVVPAPQPRVETPLLPKWAWGLGAVVLIALAFTPGVGHTSVWRVDLPAVDLSPWFTSPWLTMGLGSLTVLLALEAWLVKRRSARSIG